MCNTFSTMPLDKLYDHIEYLDRLAGEAARAEFDAKRDFKQYKNQKKAAMEVYRKRRNALRMAPEDRLIALVEDLMKRGWKEMANHVSENWADDDGVVVVIGLEDFDEDNRAALVTAAESCGFVWRGF